jgi:hypothetical protein
VRLARDLVSLGFASMKKSVDKYQSKNSIYDCVRPKSATVQAPRNVFGNGESKAEVCVEE